MLSCRSLKLLVGGIVMIQFEPLFKQVLPVLQSKLEEMRYYNYDGFTVEDLWNYCVEKKWRKKNVLELPLYEVVSDIYSIKSSDIVNFLQIQQFNTTNWFSDISQEELHELLKPKKKNNE